MGRGATARAEAETIELATHEVARGTIPGSAGVLYRVGDRLDLSRGNAESLEKCGLVRRLPAGTPAEEQRKVVLRAERDLPTVEAGIVEQTDEEATATKCVGELDAHLASIDALVRKRPSVARAHNEAVMARNIARNRLAELTERRAELKAVLEG